MATDEQRRKVAAELRELAANRHYVDEYIAADTVGFWRGEATEGFDSDSLLEVADLVDRPTCEMTREGEGFRCSACGAFHDMSGFEKFPWPHCPNCGAVVRR